MIRRVHEHYASHTDFYEHDCAHCGACTVVEVTGQGGATGHTSLLHGRARQDALDAELATHAQQDSLAHAARRVDLMKCPRCDRRGPRFSNYVAARTAMLAASLLPFAFVLWAFLEDRRARFDEGLACWGMSLLPFAVTAWVVASQWGRDVRHPPTPIDDEWAGAGEAAAPE